MAVTSQQRRDSFETNARATGTITADGSYPATEGVDVRQLTRICVGVNDGVSGGAWDSASIAVEVSDDGSLWIELESESSELPMTADSRLIIEPCITSYLRLKVSSAGSNTKLAYVIEALK